MAGSLKQTNIGESAGPALTLRDHRSSCPGEASRSARRLLAPLKRQIDAMTQALVRADTVAVPPDGNENAGQTVLGEILKQAGVEVEIYEVAKLLQRSNHPYVRLDRNYAGRRNLIARIPGTGQGRSLILTGHMDTVPADAGQWKDDPWSGTIRGGTLHGRGAWDMKGGLAAQFAVLLALRRAGLRLAGDVLAESVVDEEWAGGGGTLAGRLRGDNADAAVIAEGTNLAVVRATRGGHFFDLTVAAGDPSLYFSSDEVASPVVPMGRLLGWIDGWSRRRRRIRRGKAYRDFNDPAPVQVLALEANRFDPGTPWSVPLTAKVRVYFQFLPHEDVPGLIREIRTSLAAFCCNDPFFRSHPPRWDDIVHPPLLGHELAAEHPWTRCLAASATACLGSTVPVGAAPYPCDAFLLQREFGIPTLLFGPCGSGAHNADECATVRSIHQTAEVLLTAALQWCG